MTDLLLMLAAAFAGAVALWFGGRRSGVSAARAKQTATRLEAVKQAQEVENEVEALDRDTLKHRARRWVRGSSR